MWRENQRSDLGTKCFHIFQDEFLEAIIITIPPPRDPSLSF